MIAYPLLYSIIFNRNLSSDIYIYIDNKISISSEILVLTNFLLGQAKILPQFLPPP